MKSKTGKIIITSIIGAVVIAGAILIVKNIKDKKGKDEKARVYAEAVADIIGTGYYSDNRYIGKVESQEVTGVDKSDDKQVKEIFVEVGDSIKKGDKLFSYDIEEMALKVKQLELELTSINNSINNANDEMKKLIKERDEASADIKVEYTAQIQGLQAQINQYSYDASAKKLEIDRQKNSLNNAIVYAPIDGVVKKINKDNGGYNSGISYDGGYGAEGSNHFIEIMAMGDYRVKATVNEMKARNLLEGQPVIVRSRIDDSLWRGTISKVDLEHPIENNSGYYEGGEETATKYPFYVALDSIDGLMLGQHVYVELDYGQGEIKDGLWLPEYYMINEDGNYYVWAEDEDGYTKKLKLEVGEYDENLCQYEILGGLSEDDYIAYPEERIKTGMKVTHNINDVVYDEDENPENEIDDDEIGNIDGKNYDDYVDDNYADDNYADDNYADDDYADDYVDDNFTDDDFTDDDFSIEEKSDEKGGAVE